VKIDHFAFEVSDLEASARFYCENLGFRVQISFIDENIHETLVVLELDGGKLELIQALDEHNQPKSFEPVTVRAHFCPHLALETDDFEKSLAQIHKNGLKIVQGPLEIPGLAKWLYLADPDQNIIEVFQEFGELKP
jgi:catechol 2,3-dioxygenase-like lactoylglutathione lyase family enzyme